MFVLFVHQEARMNLSTCEYNAHTLIVYCYQNFPQNMQCVKATTHVYVKMVAVREHLHMRKYSRLQ